MSSSYSANQYDNAFKSQRLQNWCEPKPFKERPSAQAAHTTFIANDRGHLLPGVVKRGSAWPDFRGTWDLPARIPAYHINPTGRSVEGLNRLKSWGFDPEHTGRSQTLRSSRNKDSQQDAVKQTDGDIQQDGVAPFSAAEARPSSECHRVTEGKRTASQNQDSQETVAGPVAQAAEDKEATEAPGKDRLLRQGSAAEQGTAAETGIVRPGSKLSEKAGSQASQLSSMRRTARAVNI